MTSSSPLILTITAGESSGRYSLAWDTVTYPLESPGVSFDPLLNRLQPVLVGGRDPAGEHSPLTLLREIGTRLWQMLLPSTAPEKARQALEKALRAELTPLLFALPPSLAVLPWELLCDPSRPDDMGFLARQRPLVRLVAGDSEQPQLAPPLRVLLLISSPPGLNERQRVDVESERAAVERATQSFREAGLLHLQVEDIVSLRRVQQALLRFKPHILHYIGHGAYEEGLGGFLEWEDDQGEPQPLPDRRLADLLRPRGLRAVLLHGCETANQEKHTDFRGVAAALLGAGIPAVLAQQASFTYQSSQQASEMFYTALTSGLGLAEATFEARQALAQADRPDWAVPTLQATLGGLAPLLDPTAAPGPSDPALEHRGATTDLPTPTGVFVGRQRELRALRALLENGSQSGAVMALITGPGGVGKSTLAAQAVTRYGERFKGALTLTCTTYAIDLFLQRIAEFLKRQGAPGLLEETLLDPKLSTAAKIEEAVEALNRAGPFLLIVDNLESVQREDRTLADADLLFLLQKLLTNLRGGRVIVTGRYAVEGLLPAGKFAAHVLRLDLDDLSKYEVEQLMARHPSLARLGKSIREEVVREFGGLPYVYDLLSSDAASQDLAALIRDVQGRITQERQRRTRAEWEEIRHRVVEFAALEETISRLSPQARNLLAQLSVFQRPFPLQAMEQGLSAERPRWQELLDWALLRFDPVESTYRLHSLTAHYAQKLLETPDRENTQRHVADWYLHYARNESHDLSDFLEAYRLLRASGQIEQAGELALNLTETLRRWGLYQLVNELCMNTLNDTLQAPGALTARAKRELGAIALLQGDYQEARQLLAESLTIDECLGDQRGKAATLHQLGIIAQMQGDYEEARRLLVECLTIDKQLDDPGGKAATLSHLGIIAQHQGDYQEARRLFAESLTIQERLGDQTGKANTLVQLGIIAQDQGDYQEARRLFAESLTIEGRLGDQRGKAATLHHLGMIAQDQGDYQEARRLFAESLAIKEYLGDQRGKAITLHHLGMIAQDQGDYQEARRLFAESLTIEERLGDQRGKAATLHHLGMIAQDQGDYEEARRLFVESLSIKERLGDQDGKAATLHQLGIIAQEQGDYQEARRLFAESLTIKEHLGDLDGKANSLGQLGIIAQQQGNYEEARKLFAESLIIAERLGDQQVKANSLGQLGLLAYEQGDFAASLSYTVQALIIFERLRSPYRRLALQQIARIRTKVGETRFMALWREVVGEQPPPDLPAADSQQQLLERLINWIQSGGTLDKLKQGIEEDPELLNPEADKVLEQLAAAQEDKEVQQAVEFYRQLLARCREVGVAAAFDERVKREEQQNE